MFLSLTLRLVLRKRREIHEDMGNVGQKRVTFRRALRDDRRALNAMDVVASRATCTGRRVFLPINRFSQGSGNLRQRHPQHLLYVREDNVTKVIRRIFIIRLCPVAFIFNRPIAPMYTRHRMVLYHTIRARRAKRLATVSTKVTANGEVLLRRRKDASHLVRRAVNGRASVVQTVGHRSVLLFALNLARRGTISRLNANRRQRGHRCRAPWGAPLFRVFDLWRFRPLGREDHVPFARGAASFAWGGVLPWARLVLQAGLSLAWFRSCYICVCVQVECSLRMVRPCFFCGSLVDERTRKIGIHRAHGIPSTTAHAISLTMTRPT